MPRRQNVSKVFLKKKKTLSAAYSTGAQAKCLKSQLSFRGGGYMSYEDEHHILLLI
jgi:hypothetical protein